MSQTNDSRAAVLIVDDSVFLRKRVRQALETEYTLVEADSGKSALNEVSKRKFDCILTDLLMPELDGFGLLEALQRQRVGTPVIVLTADIQKTTRERCHELGASALIQKPVNPESLRALLASVLRG